MLTTPVSVRILTAKGKAMEYGLTLIDKAGENCGSFYSLSKRTGIIETHISAVRRGKRRLPLEWVPLLADAAGVDPWEALGRVLAEQAPAGSLLHEILVARGEKQPVFHGTQPAGFVRHHLAREHHGLFG